MLIIEHNVYLSARLLLQKEVKRLHRCLWVTVTWGESCFPRFLPAQDSCPACSVRSLMGTPRQQLCLIYALAYNAGRVLVASFPVLWVGMLTTVIFNLRHSEGTPTYEVRRGERLLWVVSYRQWWSRLGDMGLSRGTLSLRSRPTHRSHTLATFTHLLFIVIAWLRIEATLERQHWNLKEKRGGGSRHVWHVSNAASESARGEQKVKV